MCEAFNKTPVTKTLLGVVHKLLTLYMSLPVASATSERTYFCPPLTQELPKKHHEAGLSEQVPTYALSQIDCQEVCFCQRNAKNLLRNSSRGIRLPWCTINPDPPPSPPPTTFQNAPPPLGWLYTIFFLSVRWRVLHIFNIVLNQSDLLKELGSNSFE